MLHWYAAVGQNFERVAVITWQQWDSGCCWRCTCTNDFGIGAMVYMHLLCSVKYATVIHCWPAYHLLLSNLYKEFRTQLFVCYLTLVFVLHLDYNSSTGYLSSTELHLSYACSCI